MHYDDELRGYNLLGGFVLGAVVGAGLGLLVATTGQERIPRRIHELAGRPRKVVRRRRSVNVGRMLRHGTGRQGARSRSR